MSEYYICPICNRPSKLSVTLKPRKDLLCDKHVKLLESGKLTQEKVEIALGTDILNTPKAGSLKSKFAPDLIAYIKTNLPGLKDLPFYDMRKCLEQALLSLPIKENVVDIFYDNSGVNGSQRSIYFLTDQNNLFACSETKRYPDKFFSTDYDYEYKKTSLDDFSIGDAQCVTYQSTTDALQQYAVVVYNAVALFTKARVAEGLLKKLDAHAKKYGPKGAEAESAPATPASTTKAKSNKTATKKDSKTDEATAGASKIQELRKLYEDGLITKAEFLDLLKNA